ncbi:hypothetical protein BDA96_04G371400 [Sorghum bicolor]|uniref:Uncharacterized protein n=1 Tax=Sorghum bicolor TaxID=4558 RepID=A0A921RAT9_SORBI|nr:hypothetical protein BDA96_04G371400 [Sorghum bicolor]
MMLFYFLITTKCDDEIKNCNGTQHELINPACSISGNSTICSLQVKRATAMAFKLYILSGHLHEFSLQLASSKHTLCMLDGCFREEARSAIR